MSGRDLEQMAVRFLDVARCERLAVDDQIAMVVHMVPGTTRDDYAVAQFKGGPRFAVPRTDADVWKA